MRRIIHVYFCFTIAALATTSAGRRATHCNTQYPLLDLLVSDDRITSSSYMEDHTPSEARISGEGWCADRESICEVESNDHYIQIDFGDEVVVEAIAIDSVEDFVYVTKYYVEYGSDVDESYCVISEESNEAIFDGADICRGNSDAEVKNFAYPVITQYIRVVPLEWEGASPCLRLELYGCYVKECSQIRDITSNASLPPVVNIQYSTSLVDYMDITDVWCAYKSDSSPNANLIFTEPVYLLYAVFRGRNDYQYVTNFSMMCKNPSGENITYTNVDGVSFFRLNSPNDHFGLLWTPINTSRIQLSVHEYVNSRSCIGMDLYGCTYNEVINHATDGVSMMETTTEAANPTSCADRPDQISVITVTTTVQVSMTPQISCSCSNQQQTSASSSSDSNVVTICIPVVVVFGVIILIVLVVIGILIWRKFKSRSVALPYDKVVQSTTTTVENDLYGLESTLSKSLANNNETSHNGVQGDRKDSVKYNYPKTVIRPNQPAVTYETVSLDEEDAPETPTKTNSDVANPVYSEVRNLHDDPKLEHNPAYSKTTDHS